MDSMEMHAAASSTQYSGHTSLRRRRRSVIITSFNFPTLQMTYTSNRVAMLSQQ